MSSSPVSSPPAASPTVAPPPSVQPLTSPPTAAAPKTADKHQTKRDTRPLPPYNVVLLNDDDHTYTYVIEMLGRLFGYGADRGFDMARTVDLQGRVIVLTTHKEKAELKRDQIRGFGSDPRIEHCTCSMGAIIEPTEAP